MRTLNKVYLIGSVGKDPDMRSTGGGTLVATLSMATSERYKDSSGEWQTKTEWHNLTAFARTAELFRDYVQKGSPIHVEGHLQTQQWEKDGVKHYKTVIVVENLIMLGGGEKSKQASGQSQSSSRREAPRANAGQQRNNQQSQDRTPSWEPGQEIEDSEIPF